MRLISERRKRTVKSQIFRNIKALLKSLSLLTKNYKVPIMLRSFLIMVILLSFSTFYSSSVLAKDSEISTGFFSDTAVSGYDTVAYFKQNKAVEGLKKYSTEYKGATWLFSSEQNKLDFIASPEKFAPQYGGYCAYAISNNNTASGDPELWSIHDNKLYLSYNKDIEKKWEKDKEGIVKNANGNWPKILD